MQICLIFFQYLFVVFCFPCFNEIFQFYVVFMKLFPIVQQDHLIGNCEIKDSVGQIFHLLMLPIFSPENYFNLRISNYTLYVYACSSYEILPKLIIQFKRVHCLFNNGLRWTSCYLLKNFYLFPTELLHYTLFMLPCHWRIQDNLLCIDSKKYHFNEYMYYYSCFILTYGCQKCTYIFCPTRATDFNTLVDSCQNWTNSVLSWNFTSTTLLIAN